MNENALANPESRQLDIFARRILGKAILRDYQVVFQEEDDRHASEEDKFPLRLYIVNHGADTSCNEGSPVRCVKLCKRLIDPGYPENVLIYTQKSKVIIRFQLVLIAEFEDSSFDVIILPKNLSSMSRYNPETVKAFVDKTVIDKEGVPIFQRQNRNQPYEAFVIKKEGKEYTSFEYSVTIPFSSFSPSLESCQIEDPTLQSFILLKNMRYDAEVGDITRLCVGCGNNESIWTTIVDLSLYEDIIDKIGIDQDILVPGIPIDE